MRRENFEKFEGFDFEISPKELLVDIEEITIYDDGTATTGDVYDIDDDFNKNMKIAEKEIFQILKECK